jgi:hypothetical protein
MKWFALLLVAIGIQSAQSQPKEIIIIRHAEEPGGNSIHLSSKGQKRAQALADFFQTNAIVTRYGLPVALFAPRSRPNQSKRSEETLVPTSQALGETIREPVTQEQYLALAQRILRAPDLKGKTVVIAWTHSYIAPLAAALGARPKPRAWKSSVYDRAWVITRSGGRVTLADIPQHLLSGDSKH